MNASSPSSTLGSLLLLTGQVPFIFLTIILFNPEYLLAVLIPFVGFTVAEIFFRPPMNSLGHDGSRLSKSTIVILAISLSIQLILVSSHLLENKPFDITDNTKDFTNSYCYKFCLLGQFVAVTMWNTSLAQLKGRFTRNLEIVDGHTLHRSGLYSALRHPGYASVLWVVLFTCFAVTRNPVIAAFTTLLMYSSYCKRIKDEEAMLIGHFGKEYMEYRRETGDLLPWVNIAVTLSIRTKIS